MNSFNSMSTGIKPVAVNLANVGIVCSLSISSFLMNCQNRGTKNVSFFVKPNCWNQMFLWLLYYVAANMTVIKTWKIRWELIKSKTWGSCYSREKPYISCMASLGLSYWNVNNKQHLTCPLLNWWAVLHRKLLFFQYTRRHWSRLKLAAQFEKQQAVHPANRLWRWISY